MLSCRQCRYAALHAILDSIANVILLGLDAATPPSSVRLNLANNDLTLSGSQALQRKRGAIRFPPPPPYPELAPPPSVCAVPSTAMESFRPVLSDLAQDRRTLVSVSPEQIHKLALNVQHTMISDSLKTEPVLECDDDEMFAKCMKDFSPRLVVVDFFATWCGPCKALAPLFATIAAKTPGVRFLKCDIEKCDVTASRK